jgi:hypothetical protein
MSLSAPLMGFFDDQCSSGPNKGSVAFSILASEDFAFRRLTMQPHQQYITSFSLIQANDFLVLVSQISHGTLTTVLDTHEFIIFPQSVEFFE